MTAWLCLAVVLLTGVTPAQGGVVLCIEEDGCVSVEVRARGAECAGCEGHETAAASEQSAAIPLEGIGCPCVDLAMPGARHDQRALPKSLELQAGPWIAPASQIRLQALVEIDAAPHALAKRVPRPPDVLALIQTVVLLR